jgi:hypothetical protein
MAYGLAWRLYKHKKVKRKGKRRTKRKGSQKKHNKTKRINRRRR